MLSAFERVAKRMLGAVGATEVLRIFQDFLTGRGALTIQLVEVPPSDVLSGRRIINYDTTGWADHYMKHSLYRTDPCMEWVQGRREFFTWQQLNNAFPMSEVTPQAREFQLYDGIVMTVPTINYFLGVLIIAGPGLEFEDNEHGSLLSLYKIFTQFYVDKVHRQVYHMPADQLLILQMLSTGKTRSEVTQRIGLSLSTVEKKLRAAREAMGARTNVQMYIIASKRGLI
ncbi:MAG: autoinducer binding domain-containing protein [Kordiimonadaceae bacterium]|nr:autoinducer binding domain-containing protein [Kordiimonadaceae bacterium]